MMRSLVGDVLLHIRRWLLGLLAGKMGIPFRNSSRTLTSTPAKYSSVLPDMESVIKAGFRSAWSRSRTALARNVSSRAP